MLALFIFATMVVVSVLYFNDLGPLMILKFWGAYLAGYLLVLLSFDGAGHLVLLYHALVSAAFVVTAKANT